MPANGIPNASPGMTGQQQQAVRARGVSVALSAGAGCGKTFVLTERFLAELAPDGPLGKPRLNQLAAITFTERAAREMRDRIRKACRQRLLDCPEDQADYWSATLRDLDAARISTIHSFCGALLRGHAVEAGIDPRFRVLDAVQMGTFLFQATDEVLRQHLSDGDETTLALVTHFGLERLRAMVSELLAERQQIDWSAWREETADGLAARWAEFWRTDTVPRVLRQISGSRAARTLCDVATRWPPAPPAMRQRCEVLRDLLPRLALSTDAAADLAAVREAAKVQGGATKKSWGDEAAFERFKDAAKDFRAAIDKVTAQMRFDAAAARPAAELALRALRLAADLDAVYRRKKQELGVLDFDDLLIRARDLLVGAHGATLRKRLAGQIRLLLVDEFQDTDPLQVEMVKALCDNEHLRGKLFFVGDHKQSIYRFRGARPQVFRDLREEIPAAGRLPLSLNFRSQPAVLEFVNALFADELGPEYEPLQASRPQVAPRPAVEFLWAAEETAEEDGSEAASADSSVADSTAAENPQDTMGRREQLLRREAEWIARRIRGMIDRKEEIVWDAEAAKAGRPTTRAVREGDIALLFRALTSVEYYEEALRRHDIHYYLVGGRAFYGQQEIYDLLNTLQAINSPSDDISLAGTLRSPMFGILDETLLWLARGEGLSAGLFAAEPPPELDEQQRGQVAYAAETLRTLRAMKDRLPVAALIHEILDRTSYDALLPAEFLGERKLANLHKLIEQARSFDRTGIFGLADFITQLSEFVARQPDEALAATHPESADVVKLMSIHQSKGLEFPVVIVPDMGRPRRNMGPAIAFTPRLGPMCKDPDATTGYDLFMTAEREEDLAETSRLLYVATTRAADYLILSSGVRTPGEAAGPWMELLQRRFDLTTGARQQDEEDRGRPVTEAAQTTDNVRVTTRAPAILSKPLDHRQRRDLRQIVEKARQMAGDGQGKHPRYLAPVAHDPSTRRHYSFSRLTGRLRVVPVADGDDATGSRAEDDDVLTLPRGDARLPVDSRPPLDPRESVDPRELGIWVHAVLAEIDFGQPGDVGAVVRRHAPAALQDHEGVILEVTDMVRRFLASPRAAALAAAGTMHRELEFLMAWPLADSAGGARQPSESRNGPSYLEGFIDAMYRDTAGLWRIVDYKTNQVTPESLPAVAAHYELQMSVYALAVERILKSSPAELVLCFLRPGLEYQFPWGAAARRRAETQIESAVAASRL